MFTVDLKLGPITGPEADLVEWIPGGLGLRFKKHRRNYRFSGPGLRRQREGRGIGFQDTTEDLTPVLRREVRKWLVKEVRTYPGNFKQAVQGARRLATAAQCRALNRLIQAACVEIRAEGRRVVPVVTGRLRASLGCNALVRNGETTFQMASNVPYAQFVADRREFDNVAIRAGVRRYNQLMVREVKAAVSALTRGL